MRRAEKAALIEEVRMAFAVLCDALDDAQTLTWDACSAGLPAREIELVVREFVWGRELLSLMVLPPAR